MAEYGVDIALRVTGEERLNKVLRAAGQLETRMKAIKAIDITAPGTGKLGDEIRKALVPFRDLARESVNTGKGLKNTQARMQAVAESFRFLSNNAKIGSADFKNFTIAADNQARALSKVAIEQENIIRAARGMQSVEERQIQLAQRQIRLLELRRKKQAELNLASDIARGGPSSPIGGATNIPGSPAFLAARRKAAVSNAVIGGAFPLLFGQGIGAAAGGGLGGALGGMAGGQFGFGLSLVGTALGQVFDNLANSAKDTAKALKDPITQFDVLKQASVLASSSQERYIESLLSSGQIAKANSVIQTEVLRKVGIEGSKNLANLDSANNKLTRTLAELGIQIQSLVAGPLAAFLSSINKGLNVFTQANQAAIEQQNFVASLPPAQQQRYAQRSTQLASRLGMASPAERDAAIRGLQAEFQQYASPQNARLSPEAQKRLQLEQGTTRELQKQRDVAAAQLQLSGLDISRNQEAYVAASKRVAQQEYENKLLEIKNTMLREGFNLERNKALITTANLQYAAQLQQIDKQSQDQTRQNGIDNLNLLKQQLQVNIQSREDYAKIVEFQKGTVAALDYQLKTSREIGTLKISELNIEEAIAIKSAKTGSEQEKILQIYNIKKAMLNNELYLTERIAQQQKIITDYTQRRAVAQAKTDVVVSQLEGQTQILGLQEQIGRIRGQDVRSLETQKLLTQQDTQRVQLLSKRQELELQLGELGRRQAEGENVDKAVELVNIGLQDVSVKERSLAVIQQMEQQQLLLNQHAERFGGIYNSFSAGLTDSFSLLIEGTDAWAESLQNIAGNVLQNIANELLRIFVINQAISALQGIFAPKVPGIDRLASFNAASAQYRAGGGPVSAGSSYIVGERGPEMFVPRSSGSVYPNDAMGIGGANIVVNVDATGSSAQGDNAQSNRLGEAIGVAVRQELIKQKRPGGLLA